jgi:hypothetical protein
MEALWATILFSGFALEVIIRHRRVLMSEASKVSFSPLFLRLFVSF